MTIETNKFGYLVITNIVDNQLITRKYQGYTEQEAKLLFKRDTAQQDYNNKKIYYNCKVTV